MGVNEEQAERQFNSYIILQWMYSAVVEDIVRITI